MIQALTFMAVHLWTIVSGVISLLILWYVPQIKNLWWQMPRVGLELAGFLLFLAALVLLYPVTLVWLWQRTLLRAWNDPLRAAIVSRINNVGFLRRLTTVLFLPARKLTSVLFEIAARAVSLSKGTLGLVLLAAMFVFGATLCLKTPLTDHRIYLMAGGFARMFGAWLVLVAAWLSVGRWLGAEFVLSHANSTDQDVSSAEQWKRLWHGGGRILSWLAMVTIAGEFLWVAALWKLPYLSFRLYSIWAAFHIPFVVTALAALIDYAQKMIGSFVRLGVGLLVLAMVAFPNMTGTSRIQDPPAQRVSSSEGKSIAKEDPWMKVLKARLDRMPDGPVVIVAASGGGSRAALFTSLVMQHLSSEPMLWKGVQSVSQDMDSSSAAPLPDALSSAVTSTATEKMNAENADAPSTWGQHILLISSVSGGSLASARFAAEPQIAVSRVSTLQHTTRDELWTLTLERLLSRLEPPNNVKDSLSETTAPLSEENENDSAEEQARLKTIQSAMDQTTTSPNDDSKPEAAGSDAIAKQIVSNAFSSEFVDEMSADFMAPMLRGAMTPFATRGDSLYHFWNETFGWTQLAQCDLQEHVRNRNAGEKTTEGKWFPAPLLLLNTTDVETGRRVVAGFPNLPAGFLPATETFKDQIVEGISTQNRSKLFGPVSIDDFLKSGSSRLSLARAVRLSSNFPWGFGVQQFDSQSSPVFDFSEKAPRVRGQNTRTTLELIDGGVVDNTGLDTLAALFDSLFLRAESDPFGEAALIIEMLRKRGIVFVEIDSGAKPTPGESVDSPFGPALRPLTALNNATYTNALRISDNLVNSFLIRFAVSETAATLSRMNIESLETLNPYFNGLEPAAIRAALGIVIPPESNPDRALSSFHHFRFTCNHNSEAKADVMTAFALGPRDKASVMATFLPEALRWKQWAAKRSGSYQEYLSQFRDPNSPLPEDVASQVAYQLIDRTQGELQSLKDIQDSGRTLSAMERQRRLKRIVTLLLSIRSLSNVDGAWSQKNNLWSQLAELNGDEAISQLVEMHQVVAAQAPQIEPSGEAPSVIQQPTPQIQFDPSRLSDLLARTSNVRATAVEAVEQQKQKQPTQAPEMPAENAATSKAAASPYLNDAIRQQNELFRQDEQRAKFYESKF